MKVFLLFYFIHWFYVFGVGVGGLGQGPSALAQIPPLDQPDVQMLHL